MKRIVLLLSISVLATLISSWVNLADAHQGAQGQFQLLGRYAIHAHDVGWQTNIVLLVLALFFCARGSTAFGLDNLMEGWVIRIF